MHQIVGTQDLTPGHEMHGCGDHIVYIIHADHIRIRIIQSYDRIDLFLFQLTLQKQNKETGIVPYSTP